ncbi:MAG: hypothetical protein CMO55_20925 [Verrucomicrobiales bacterium]|nr:hypothetical protein [Verrucomicrobiales bacterium]
MDKTLDRKPLSDRLADQIQLRIQQGYWDKELPGYRVLAEEFGVSWRTSRSALKTLENRGILHPFEHGKPRRIRESGLYDRHSPESLLLITSATTHHDIAELELIDEIILTWLKLGGRSQQVRVDFRRHKNPAFLLNRLIEKNGAEVLVIREPSKPWVEAARDLSIPVYFLGGDIPVSERPTVSGFAVSIIAMVSESVSRLRKLGHQRILIPDEGFGTLARDAVLTGMQNGFGEAAIPDPALCCPGFPEVEPETWQTYWNRAFRNFHPTAVIVRKESSYLSLFSFCYENSIKVPHDLSIICHSASENLQWCHPQPDRSTFPKKRAVTLFRRWIKNSFPLTGMKILPVNFIEAGTVSKPARQKQS